MKSVFFNSEVLNVEKKIIDRLSIPSIILMENAGRNAADFIVSKLNSNSKVVILAGKGNNTGDGFVIARHLANHKIKSSVILLYPQSDLKGDALINFDILKSYKNSVSLNFINSWTQMKSFFDNKNLVIIDAVFGIGFKGELEPRLQTIFKEVNEIKRKTVFAIDTPSGLYNYNQTTVCIKADHTISMGVKKFHSLFFNGREAASEIYTVDIGVSEKFFDDYNETKMYVVEEKDITKFIPTRKVNSYKYSSGKVFALAGSKGLTGAAYLCSQSALVAGSGAVILGVPDSLNTILARKLTEVMTAVLPETSDHTFSPTGYDKIKEKIKWADCLLIGPGVSKNPETLELVSKIINENDIPVVLDADGLTAFKNAKSKRRKNKIILTPHIGEFANLLNISTEEVKKDFYNLSVKFAKEKNVILILKGSPSIITDGDSFYINSSGNSILSTAGSGDVLSGIIASIYSRTKIPMESALAGVYIHGKCADLLYTNRKNNFTFQASNIIDKIPLAVNAILNSTDLY
ncbi:MAG: NAD(P)H-hydrate dehydratase [Bacteroidetes bacterium]|nr:NAD(P)H-hydrate dehydratase [Bacteroidota bacterium]